MFVRQKPNRSGSVSIQVVDKSNGYRLVKTMGCAKDPEQICRLVELGKLFIARRSGQYPLFPAEQQSNALTLDVVRTLENASIRTMGPELILGKLFDEIGFGIIPEELFRDIVVARLAYPSSKLKTVDYLIRYRGKSVSVQEIYRFLDRLKERYAQLAQRVAYEYSCRILQNVSVVFYDMTTLYFEAEDEDDLRRIGFSKDGKFQNPQIMLGLLIGEGGYPLGYDIFEGNTFEGRTLLPVLEGIARRYDFGKPVVVADAAMLSQDNLRALEAHRYPFIVAARIRNETQAVQDEILKGTRGIKSGQWVVIDQGQNRRLIVTYSDQRARKDAYNRERGLRRLRQRIRGGRMTKEQLNNRGYNKFLKLSGTMTVQLDETKVQQASRWDGLKGYLTNTDLPPSNVVENYAQLWQVEKAFRISKTDLRVRPVYHYRRRRIEAHVLIAFIAYTIYKELERRLTDAKLPMSPRRAIDLTQTMYEMTFTLPNDPRQQRILLKMDPEQQALYDLLH
jgi:transposase